MRGLISLIILFAGAAAAKTYNDGKGDTVDCAKDASITININNATFVLKGGCESVSINGNNNKITAASIAGLTVNGNSNAVDVGASDRITTNGNDNTVTFGKGVTKAKPSTSNPGSRNTIAAAAKSDKPAADKPADKPAMDKPAADKPAADKPAADKPASGGADAIDCTKQPTYSIPNGRGTYKFTGTCDKISVTGGENTLAIEAVKELAVAGASNTINVGAADKISVVGANNTIGYKKGLSGAKPVTKVVGSNNKLAQVK